MTPPPQPPRPPSSSYSNWPPTDPATWRPATPGDRAIAYLADLAVVSLGLIVLNVLLIGIGSILGLALIVLYEVLPLTTWGATPGKMMVGLLVVDERGQKPSAGAAFTRWILNSFLCCGPVVRAIYLAMLPSAADHRTPADRGSHTYVCKIR